jgi:dynein heavy chain
MRMLGLEGRQISFIFSDGQIYQESLLEDICNLLNIGEIPNLFGKEDKQKVV